jgi:hypothetical protein
MEKEASMALEQQQVNVQELQRLNDAITVTMEAIRRVAPQLALLQQQQLQQLYGLQQQPPFGMQMGIPFGLGGVQDPITAQLLQHQALRNLYQQGLGIGGIGGIGQSMVPFGNPWQQQQYGASFQQPFVNPWQQQYGNPFQQQFGNPFQQQYGNPFQQQYGNPFQQQYGNPWQTAQVSPFANLQRPF